MSTQFSSIWLIDRTQSDATTPEQSRPGNDDNEGELRIPQSSSITGTSPLDCFVSFPEYPLWESYRFAEKQLVYSATPADWASKREVERERGCVCVRERERESER